MAIPLASLATDSGIVGFKKRQGRGQVANAILNFIDGGFRGGNVFFTKSFAWWLRPKVGILKPHAICIKIPAPAFVEDANDDVMSGASEIGNDHKAHRCRLQRAGLQYPLIERTCAGVAATVKPPIFKLRQQRYHALAPQEIA